MVRQSPYAPMTRSRRVAPSPAGVARPAAEPDLIEEASPLTPAPVTPVHAELGPIIRSKIQPPVLRDSTLSRPRLFERLREATQRRLTLLIAEAGYGKTTLMADFAVRTATRTLWYRLDPTDGDIVTWTNHIIAAVREYEPTFGQATLDLMAHLPAGGPPRSAFVSSVIGEMGRLDPIRTVLVLDDFHAVDQSEEASDFVVRLTRDAPPWLSLVVSARRRPTFEMARLAAADDVAELATEDLRFSLDETSDLFAVGYGTPLEDDVLRHLDDRVKGWAASLQLFHGSIRGRPATEIRALARALSGATGPIYEFLAEEVLSNLSAELDQLLIRCSLLDRIDAALVVALFGDEEPPPDLETALRWIDDAERLMLVSHSRGSQEFRYLHPLLRDFLRKQLKQRTTEAAIRQMNVRVARAVESTQPLVAAHHYVEAGDDSEAMRCLGSSVMLMMGSGQWGFASDLIARISGVPMEPAVAAIEARRLLHEGLVEEAGSVLDAVSIEGSNPGVRAAIRNARLSTYWRTGDTDGLVVTLGEIQADDETPQALKDIAQLFVDTSSHNPKPVGLHRVGRRLLAMSDTFARSGDDFYAAVAIHNATVTFLNAGDYWATIQAGEQALQAFSRLPFFAAEQLSTLSLLALAYAELDRPQDAQLRSQDALATGREFADVPALLAFAAYVTGNADAASELLVRARLLATQGSSDLAGDVLVEAAIAVGEIATDPQSAVTRLSTPIETPFDLGLSISRRVLLSEAMLAAGYRADALKEATAVAVEAQSHGAARAQARANIVRAIAADDGPAIAGAIAQGASTGELTLLETAPMLISAFHLLDGIPEELMRSIESHPRRWLPLLRRELEYGNTRSGYIAASVLDERGALEDVGLLRAYAKTYAKRGPGKSFGKKLARRVSPNLVVHDLGRVEIAIGGRAVLLAKMRRKPASVLMYLLTRPGLSANREQVVDALWLDADPSGATNNLNQSLYFLRREIDPWYEDDVSVDYVHFQSDLVWLDPDLVRSDSLDLLRSSQLRPERSVGELSRDLMNYRAPFAPEFEYEEWAMSWRSRLHSTFLDLANDLIDRYVEAADLPAAVRVAVHVLHVDEDASDVERRLVWIYRQLGLLSAARAQYAHLAATELADGFEPAPFESLVGGSLPKPD